MRIAPRTILAWAAATTAVLGSVSCTSSAPDAPTTAPDPAATSTPSVSPDDHTLRVDVAQGENGALQPRWLDEGLRAEIPAGVGSAEKYRSEVFWKRPSGRDIRLQEGDAFSCRFEVTPHLGESVEDRDQWQVLWQLHGPLADESWPPPPLNLHVRGETWRIGGGAGREDGAETFVKPFPRFIDGRTARWRIDVVVSEDPAKARVDAWLDGRRVVTDWHPPSGTRYPEHRYVTLKSGLYAGATGGSETSRQHRWTTQSAPECTFTIEGTGSTGTAG